MYKKKDVSRSDYCSTFGKLKVYYIQALQNAVLFIVLSPYDNEQSDLLHRIYEDPKLTQIPLYK